VVIVSIGRNHQNEDDCFQSECSQDANFIQKSSSSEIRRSFSMVELLLLIVDYQWNGKTLYPAYIKRKESI
jgi:hypothetical protein